ncbi:protein ref(2)P [Anopheles cruzii]|uniref:protein ref(2)P n=1 Tax=Anopheles cruzii TaxID=68878 RepID=UPI0022EC7C30|nr:protein ref(2)P [Anopheles cruzii]
MESAFEHLTKLKISVSVADAASSEAFVLFKADIPANFGCLVNLVEERFLELKTSNKGWKYFWIDEDGDEIVIAHDGEYRGYLKSIDTTPAVARIHVRVSEQPTEKTAKRTEEAMTAPKPDDRPVHSRVVCDVCDTIIIGHRYKCMTCDDYDLCMRCEGNYRHKEHIMVRLPTPDIHDGHRAYRIFEKFRGLVGKMTPLLMVADEFVAGECEPDDQGPAQAACERAECNVEKRPASKRSSHGKRSTETRSAGRETKDSKNEKSPSSSSTKKREAKAEDRERTREQRSSGHAQSAEPPLAGHGGASSNGPFADSSLRYPRAYREAADWAAALNCPYPTMDEYPETCYPARFMPFVPPQVSSNTKNFQPLPPYHPFYYGNPNYAAMFEPYVCEGPKQAHTAQAAGPSGQPPQPENPANVRAQRPRSETEPRPERPARSDSGIPESGTGGRNRAAPLFNVPEFLKNYVTPNDYVTGVQQIAETFAKIFDPLGMTLDIRPKPAQTASARAAPTTPAAGSEPATPPKPAQTQTPVEAKQDKTTETMVTSSSTVHIQTVPEQKQQRSKEMVSVAEEAVPSVSGTAKAPPPQDVAGDETDEDSVGSWDNIDGQEVAHGDDDTCECEALDKLSESIREAAEQMANSEGFSKKDSAKKSPTIEDALDDDDEKVATTAVKPPNNPDPSHIYSARPHVNHAIHTMMTMGFSNDDGWLTRLLETLNGDVPKALDMLLQQTPRS